MAGRKANTVDWRKLESYAGMTVEQIQERFKDCGHMLAFGDDKWAIQVVKTFNEHGGEAGLAALVSALFLKKHGPAAMAMAAVGIYQDIARELDKRDLACRVENMAYMVFFADHGGRKKIEWPLAWPYEDAPRRAGLANVMLGMAQVELGTSGGTCEQVAALGIQRFFEESPNKKLKGRERETVVVA